MEGIKTHYTVSSIINKIESATDGCSTRGSKVLLFDDVYQRELITSTRIILITHIIIN